MRTSNENGWSESNANALLLPYDGTEKESHAEISIPSAAIKYLRILNGFFGVMHCMRWKSLDSSIFAIFRVCVHVWYCVWLYTCLYFGDSSSNKYFDNDRVRKTLSVTFFLQKCHRYHWMYVNVFSINVDLVPGLIHINLNGMRCIIIITTTGIKKILRIAKYHVRNIYIHR